MTDCRKVRFHTYVLRICYLFFTLKRTPSVPGELSLYTYYLYQELKSSYGHNDTNTPVSSN